MAFHPFIGGKRVCLGKTFAEISAKLVISIIYSNFDFEFIDEKYMYSKPENNIAISEKAEVILKLIPKK